MMLNILHVVGNLQKSSGLSSMVKSLSEASSALHNRIHLVFPQNARTAGDQIQIDARRVNLLPVPVYEFPSLRVSLTPGFKNTLRQVCRSQRVDLIHCHGLWMQYHHGAAAVARQLRIPLLITTHGMLTRWSFSHKSWKKKLGWRLYQKADLDSAAVLQATAAPERQQLRGFGLTQPIAQIPIGIDLPEWPSAARRTGRRTILFLGRIYPVKGLLNLVAAWKLVARPGWKIVIAGPDESGHKAEVRQAVRQAGLEDDFEFLEPVAGEAKWTLYRQADLLVLPSFTENFGLVVPEALASGVPAITTQGTPWSELPARHCGWWIEIGAEPLAAALQDAMALTDVQRREMGRQGRRLVEEKYTWPGIARQMSEVYAWILSGGAMPACISLN